MSKINKLKKVYAVRNKDTKEIIKNTKCKGGYYYIQRPACQRRCDELNVAHKNFKMQTSEYEVGEYAVVDIEEYRDLVHRI